MRRTYSPASPRPSLNQAFANFLSPRDEHGRLPTSRSTNADVPHTLGLNRAPIIEQSTHKEKSRRVPLMVLSNPNRLNLRRTSSLFGEYTSKYSCFHVHVGVIVAITAAKGNARTGVNTNSINRERNCSEAWMMEPASSRNALEGEPGDIVSLGFFVVK